jgi:hypothetical protein
MGLCSAWIWCNHAPFGNEDWETGKSLVGKVFKGIHMKLRLAPQLIIVGLATCALCVGQSTAGPIDRKPQTVIGGGSADDGPVTVIGGPEFQLVSSAPIPTRVVKGAPFSLEATIDMTRTLADGNRISHHSVVHLYRDSEGRTRREEILANIGPWTAAGTPPTLVTIQDPVAGVDYLLDSEHKIASRVPSPLILPSKTTGSEHGSEPRNQTGDPGPVTMIAPGAGTDGSGNERGAFVHTEVFPAAGSPPIGGYVGKYNGGGSHSLKASPSPGSSPTTEPAPVNEKSQSLGKETIAGVSADGARTSSEIPAGAMGNERPIEVVNERWFSPELQIVLRSKRSDPLLGDTEYTVTKLERGEPPRSLFEVPADYQVRDGGMLQTGPN